MKWIAKSQIKRILPISRPKPKSPANIESRFDHIKKMAKIYCPSSLVEIGAGWDLCSSLCWHKLGVKEIYLIDIKRHVQVPLVNPILSYFGYSKITHVEDLKHLNMHYKAPADLLDVPDVELVFSNSVLEHIPEWDLRQLLKKCKFPYAMHHIDYRDHYATFDRSITPYNFLKYSDKLWKIFNPSSHYQNRLRHKDYISIFEQAGYTVEFTEARQPTDAKETLKKIKIHPKFLAQYQQEELCPTAALFFLKHKSE